MTDEELFELLASEYGYTEDQIGKLTRRKIAALVNAMGERKTGYKTSLPPATLKLSTEQEQKINEALEKRFGSGKK